jgi:hypothetical protein
MLSVLEFLLHRHQHQGSLRVSHHLAVMFVNTQYIEMKEYRDLPVARSS